MRDCWNPNNIKSENNDYSFILDKFEQKMEYYFGNSGKVGKNEKIETYEVILGYKLGRMTKRNI